jgi:uncharacterized cupredoxin-like copper-binding protein
MIGSRTKTALVMLAVVALATAACSAAGDQTTTSSSGGDETTTTAGEGQASTELATSIVEYEFTPDTWTVPAGEQVSITITNEGTLKHEWVLMQEGVNITSEADLPASEDELMADFVNVEEEVEPGETKTLTFEAPPAGTYQVICAIPGHFNAGLKGTLTSEG